MLTLLQASQTSRGPQSDAKTGLAIAGGGPVGAIYELGALRALDECLEGRRLHELDVYVGVSAGAFIAASLANRIPTSELCRIFMADRRASVKFEPERFLKPAYREYAKRAVRAPGVVADSLFHIMRKPTDFSVSRLIGAFGQLLPSGVFDNETIHNFLQQAFTGSGRSNRFEDLGSRLYIVAVDLDSGAAVRFGSPQHQDIDISRAVQASAALPGLYPPVRIGDRYFVDGALRRTLHASAALDEGVGLLFGINPLVPYDSSGSEPGSAVAARQLIRGGLPLILSQTFRALIQSRMKIGFQKYRNSHPEADLVLMEPDRGDEQIFFTNIFSYSSRSALCEHAYQVTRRELRARRTEVSAMLARHDMGIRDDVLDDEARTLAASLSEDVGAYSQVSRDLAAALDDLEGALGSG
ncbi:MAG: patatin-like phospholipase family protein [Xanthomonadales bacterium]|nr:patatin-like phospholipase family protein [Xanthomonadales bacterium]